MIIKRLVLLLLMAMAVFPMAAQTQEGFIKGKVTDASTGEFLSYASVILNLNGVQKAGQATDDNGDYYLGPLQPGTYELVVTYIGYPDFKKAVIISGQKTAVENVKLGTTASEGGEGVGTIEQFVVTGHRNLFDKDKTTTGGTLDREKIKSSPYQGNVNALTALVGGTYSADGGKPNVKAARSGSTVYIIDGRRVTGDRIGIPQSGIEQIDVITGGVPAEYGDATGGFITITTRGPSSTYRAGLDVLTSQFIDPYGYNRLEATLSGPIWTRNISADTSTGMPARKQAVLGFFVAGQASTIKDGDPYAFPIYVVKDDVLAQINANPLRQSPLGSGFVSSTEFVTLDDLETTRVKPNSGNNSLNFSGKLEFQPKDAINFTVGGQYNWQKFRSFSYRNSLFNADNNAEVINNTYAIYGRYRQSFKTEPGSAVKNAYYTIQADYSKIDQTVQSDKHEDRLFDYGYLGKFEVYRVPNFINRYDTFYANTDSQFVVGSNYLANYQDTNVRFTPGGKNPIAENYTKYFFDLTDGEVPNRDVLRAAGGLLNGQTPGLVYSLWDNPGSVYGGYSKSQLELFNLSVNGSANIRDHQLKFGVQYEQRVSRSYAVNTTGLWNLMRQLTNFHFTGLDFNNPQPQFDSLGNFTNFVYYPFVASDTAQKVFDRNLRAKLIAEGAVDEFGRPITNQSYINTDLYGPETYSLDLFSADDLFNNGNFNNGTSYVSYNGFDYLGRKSKSASTINDFLNNDMRLLPAYNPIYIAGYVQDKFEFRDITLRLGVRVDRFDANQKVLKDPFSLYPTRTVGEVSDINGATINHPGNVGEDWVVYVDDPTNPTDVVGYRDGSTWYDATGAEVQDPNVIALETKSGTIAPYLQARNQREITLSENSFEDYKPQTNLMPRISFSFPISDDAVFYANYDVLTQRPQDGVQGNIEDYYFIKSRATNIIANPNLKPERRTNYEIGFNQKLTRRSALGIQGYYGEIRDMVQIQRVNFAYPISYTTYANIDFGTVKGVILSYDFRRNNSSGPEFTANYTMQFANGTGSNANSGLNIANAGQPNLRQPLPLDYDVRHQFVTSVDYRFGVGNDYKGPIFGDGKKILENAGINFVINARSGTPFTRQSNVTQDVAIGIAQRRALTGEVNGSRLPWQFRADARINKYFALTKPDPNANRRGPSLDVYLQVQNVFNARNVINVYRYTGLPDDDGFLTSSEGAQILQTVSYAQAFQDQYRAKVINPNNYAQPRIIRLGASVEF